MGNEPDDAGRVVEDYARGVSGQVTGNSLANNLGGLDYNERQRRIYTGPTGAPHRGGSGSGEFPEWLAFVLYGPGLLILIRPIEAVEKRLEKHASLIGRVLSVLGLGTGFALPYLALLQPWVWGIADYFAVTPATVRVAGAALFGFILWIVTKRLTAYIVEDLMDQLLVVLAFALTMLIYAVVLYLGYSVYLAGFDGDPIPLLDQFHGFVRDLL